MLCRSRTGKLDHSRPLPGDIRAPLSDLLVGVRPGARRRDGRDGRRGRSPLLERRYRRPRRSPEDGIDRLCHSERNEVKSRNL